VHWRCRKTQELLQAQGRTLLAAIDLFDSEKDWQFGIFLLSDLQYLQCHEGLVVLSGSTLGENGYDRQGVVGNRLDAFLPNLWEPFRKAVDPQHLTGLVFGFVDSVRNENDSIPRS